MAGTATPGLQRSDFEFPLPPHLIAQYPAQRRDGARLMVVSGLTQRDQHIPDFVSYCQPGDVLVMNDTRVIPARLHGHKPSGGRVEVLIERALDDRRALAMVRTSHRPQPGQIFQFGDPNAVRFEAEVLGRQEDLYELRFSDSLDTVMQQVGHIPLPPYIQHSAGEQDLERYQTVYARHPGAVAAPTAGLHLTPHMLTALQAKGVNLAWVTLHVGAGTFTPVRTDNLSEHRMHVERYHVPEETARLVNAAKKSGKQVIAIGTTSVRALESSVQNGQVCAGTGETRLFILPGYRFEAVTRLLTNFHLSGSTLLMLVSAFAGIDEVRAAYAHAVAQAYRFFSYGDAMLLERNDAI